MIQKKKKAAEFTSGVEGSSSHFFPYFLLPLSHGFCPNVVTYKTNTTNKYDENKAETQSKKITCYKI